MTPSLRLGEELVLSDLRTFVSRARASDDGAIRLQATGTVLAAWVCSMRPRLLGEGTPTILGLRTMTLAEPAELDTTVSLAAVADRLARMDSGNLELAVPPVPVPESWAAVSPPRSQWQAEQVLGSDELIEAAKTGIREIAQIIPVNPGALIVNNARAAVWGRELSSHAQIPAGAAFAGYVLGFWKPGSAVPLFRSGRWLRLSSGAGHILVRPGTRVF